MVNILVVEDDVKLNQLVCTFLNDSGFRAKGCLNANDAYDEMYNNLYELIISDIMMPGIDGFEFAQTVRQVNKRIPILFMSAKDDLPSKQRGFQLGIDDYMVKPVLLDELLMRVRALLRRANIEMERKLVVGNLELDADAMTATVDANGKASSNRCSVKITVIPSSRLIFPRSAKKSDAAMGSSCEVGSSRIKISGPIAKTEARLNSCFCPPDNSVTFL